MRTSPTKPTEYNKYAMKPFNYPRITLILGNRPPLLVTLILLAPLILLVLVNKLGLLLVPSPSTPVRWKLHAPSFI